MSFFLTAVIMFIFWILLSGEFSFLLILSAVVSSLLVAYISHDLLFGEVDLKSGIKKAFRFLRYLPWLLWQILLANLDIVYRTLHPKMPVDPRIITFDAPLRSEAGIAILANSITLTPGTVTIAADREGKFIVHAISSEPAESLLAGVMQKKVKEIEGA